MADHPIIFSAPMVRALLDGRKTQTRRLATSPLRRCEVGDRLYVREAWATVNSGDGPGWAYRADGAFSQPDFDGRDYGAGPSFDYDKYPGAYTMWYSDLLASAPGLGWTPSILMPRWASRLTLIVEAVRIERLGHMSETDAIAEGIYCGRGDGWTADGDGWWASPKIAFHRLWDSLHDKTGQRWEDHPDVLVLTFRVERGNIDWIGA